MFFRTSGKSAETSLPNVIDMIVFWIASFLDCHQQYLSIALDSSAPFVGILRASRYQQRLCDHFQSTYTKPALSSNVSPFLGVANALFNLLTAIFTVYHQAATSAAPGDGFPTPSSCSKSSPQGRPRTLSNLWKWDHLGDALGLVVDSVRRSGL